MSNDNNGTVKVDEYAAMLIFGHSDWRESLGETGLDGDECQKHFNGDEPTGAEIKDPVSDVFAAAAQNRFGTNPSHVSAEAQKRDAKFRKRFDATPATDGARLEKRAPVVARIAKVGRWQLEYSANGSLIRAFEVEG